MRPRPTHLQLPVPRAAEWRAGRVSAAPRVRYASTRRSSRQEHWRRSRSTQRLAAQSGGRIAEPRSPPQLPICRRAVAKLAAPERFTGSVCRAGRPRAAGGSVLGTRRPRSQRRQFRELAAPEAAGRSEVGASRSRRRRRPGLAVPPPGAGRAARPTAGRRRSAAGVISARSISAERLSPGRPEILCRRPRIGGRCAAAATTRRPVFIPGGRGRPTEEPGQR